MIRKKFLYLLSIFSLSLSTFAQEKEVLIGKVSYKGENLENVHVLNVSTNKFSISNREGFFTLESEAGDTLVLSHVSMMNMIVVLEKEDSTTGLMEIEMTEKDNELTEVIIDDPKVDVVSVGILEKKMKKPTINERKLYTAGDFKYIHLLGIIGGSLPLDPIINAINGKTKRLKRNIKIEKKRAKISFLEDYYLDYMRETFEATEGELQQFIDHLLEKEITNAVLKSKNKDKIKFYLTDNWFKFKDRSEDFSKENQN